MNIFGFNPWQHILVKLLHHLIKNFFLRFPKLWLGSAQNTLDQRFFQFFEIFVYELSMKYRSALFKAIKIL